jgi:hypothetical protein
MVVLPVAVNAQIGSEETVNLLLELQYSIFLLEVLSRVLELDGAFCLWTYGRQFFSLAHGIC